MTEDELLAALAHHYPCAKPQLMELGIRPALLIVDFMEGFTSTESPLGRNWDREVEYTAQLIAHARTCNVPVVFTTVEYNAGDLHTNLLCMKTPHVRALTAGSRLGARGGDLIISKKYGSAFFGTSLAAQLQVLGADTLLLSGCVTSGCVRASAVDAVQSGFRAAVVRETVGDRSPLANAANLMDIEQRYGSVISLDQAREYLDSLTGTWL